MSRSSEPQGHVCEKQQCVWVWSKSVD